MRRVTVAAVAVIVFMCAQAPAPAAAQGFFQSLFGSPAQQPAFKPQPTPQSPRVVESPYGHRAPPIRARDRERDHDHDDEHGSRSFDKPGRYRTLCVRMCDGYYWPISFAARRSHFYQDANLCRSSCGEEARMFFHASRDGDTRDMVDVTGRAYSKLPTAFLYRKSTIEGCKCKPEPWAQSELDRHRLYALTEASERQRIETATAAAPAEKAAPGTSDKAVAAKFAQLATGGKSPVEKVPTENTTAPPVRVVVAELTLPSDPAVAANQSAGAGDGPEPSKPDLAPAAIAPPVLAPLPADVPAHRTPSSRVVATPEADVPKPRRTERPARQEKAERAERRSVSAEPNRPRVAQARPQAPKPSGAFGLGAGSKSARWPGE